MKLNRLETHDRLQHFTKQSFDIGECCQNLINQRPFGNIPFYIFAHTRTDDDGVTKRMIWQPRLTKPKAQTNSMLFKAFPGTDNIRVIWILPAREMWAQFAPGKMTWNQTVWQSIMDFQYKRELMEMKEPDDLNDNQIDDVYRQLSQQAKVKQVQKFKPETLGACQASFSKAVASPSHPASCLLDLPDPIHNSPQDLSDSGMCEPPKTS